jgi:hypothetical protein
MKYLRRLLRALPVACIAVVTAVDAELSEVPVDISLGVGTGDMELMQFQLEAEPRWDFTLGERGSAVTSFRLRLDGKDELEPGSPPFDNYASFSQPLTLGDAGTLEVRDLYYEHRLERGLVRVGKQQIVWGRLDGVKILDVVNPQTFREFILDDLGNSRIGLWSAYADLTIAGWRAEFTWIPDLTGHDIPESGAWFEFRAPRFRFGAPSDSPGLPTVTRRDGDWLSDGAAGARVSRSMGGVDVSLLAYSGRDHEPLGRVLVDDGALTLEQFYRQRKVFGLSAESSLGPIAWRAELSHQPNRKFNVRGAPGSGTGRLDVAELDQTTIGVGIDMQLPAELLANVQLVWDRVDEAPDSLVRPEEDQLITLFLRRSFAYETIRTEVRWYHSLTDHDDTAVATLSYEVDDNTTAYVSSEWFSGTREGLFGQFAQQDRVYLGVTRYF